MWRYILKRVALMLVTTFIILSLTFILMKLLPLERPGGFPDAIRAFYERQVNLGYMYKVDSKATVYDAVTPSIGGVVFKYRAYPVMYQYFRWLGNILTKWDWGVSVNYAPNRAATDIMASRLPVSMGINIWSILISVPLGFVFGIWAALKKNKPTDHIISTAVMVFISIPSFVVISLLIKALAYDTGWLPSQWPSSAAPLAFRIRAYIIPVACLSFGTIAGFTRYTRAELTEVMSSEFLLLARTKGLTKRQTVIRHAMRNSLVPIIPMIIGSFIGILSGSMILENLYGIPGIGDLFISALNSKDYNIVMVDMAIYTTIGLAASLCVDLSYGLIDPRIRMGARK